MSPVWLNRMNGKFCLNPRYLVSRHTYCSAEIQEAEPLLHRCVRQVSAGALCEWAGHAASVRDFLRLLKRSEGRIRWAQLFIPVCQAPALRGWRILPLTKQCAQMGDRLWPESSEIPVSLPLGSPDKKWRVWGQVDLGQASQIKPFLRRGHFTWDLRVK